MPDPEPSADEPSIPPPQRLKLVTRANHLFRRLRDVGTDRDTAGNRTLLYSHYAALVLLGMFNPAFQTLRGLHQASTLKRVQKKLGVGRASLGSLSESTAVFDPERLPPIIDELVADLPASVSGPGPRRGVPDTIPQELAAKLVAVDGTAVRALPQIVRATADGAWKLHLHFRPLRGLPVAPILTPGAVDERDVLALTVDPGCVYIADRGYERYGLFNRIVRAGSDYVIRIQNRPVEVIETRPVSPAAVAARVVSDEVVTLGPDGTAHRVAGVDHPVRRIVIAGRDRGRVRTDRTNADVIVLVTNRVDIPAEVIAAIYALRWSIELFFRFLKQVLGCKRLLSGKPDAVAIQVYCALIACLLLAQVTGGRVTMDHFRLICLYLQGWADDEELIRGLTAKPKAKPPPKGNA